MTVPPTTRLLLVEDDPQIRASLVAPLGRAGFDVLPVESVSEARLALTGAVDLILLDLGLPDEDGLDLCRELRRANSHVPVIIVTARDATHQRIRGLELGADDYVTKPFDLDELVARVRTVLRRSGHRSGPGRLQAGDLWLDQAEHRAGRGAHEVPLKPREFELLAFLMRHPDRVWTREQLLERVWDRPHGGETRTVDLHVQRLRAKLERDASDPDHLQTIWGVGYKLVAATGGAGERD